MGRGQILSPTAVKKIALKYNNSVFETNDLYNPLLISKINQIQPDISVVVAYKILPKEIYEIAKIATINLHASLLPIYQGASPIQYTLLNGDSYCGLTSFIINEKIDSGEIILQKKIKIDDKITYNCLYDKLSSLGGELISKSIHLINQTNFKPKSQNKNLISLAPKIKKSHYRINWNNDAIDIHNQIRAFSYKGAYTYLNHKIIKFFETYYHNDINNIEKLNKIGDFSIINNRIFILTGDGLLSAKEIQIEGKLKICIKDYIMGNRYADGMKFG